MSEIRVVIAENVKREGVLIHPAANPNDVFDKDTGETKEAHNVLAEGGSGLAALRKYYGR